MSVPKQLIVSYENGSTKKFDFNKLDRGMQSELAKLGLCPPPLEISPAKHFVLLQWKDGWKEVIGSDKDAVDLLRCFVIRRIEDRGRLAFEVGEEYPDLYILRRMPMDLNRLWIVGEGSVKSYDLGKEVERWEGTFDAGGKLENVKWDKIDPEKYPSEVHEGPEILQETLDTLEKALDTMGVGAQGLLGMEESQRAEAYSEIAKALGVRGYQRQADVYGFMELLVKRLDNS